MRIKLLYSVKRPVYSSSKKKYSAGLFIKLASATLISCLSSFAFAFESGGRIALGFERSDNARQTELDPLPELQTLVDLDLFANHESETISLGSNYSLSKILFSEDSQEEQSNVNGVTALRLGAFNDYLQLFVDHSRTLSLIDPTEQDLFVNTQDRDIFTARPQLNIRLSPVDTLRVNLSQTAIRYSENQGRDADIASVGVVLQHRLSSIDYLIFNVSKQTVEYDNAFNTEIVYDRVSIGYGTALRKLAYSINVGYNSSSLSDDSVGGVSLSAQFDYTSGFISYGLSYLREITDNAQGSGVSFGGAQNGLLPNFGNTNGRGAATIASSGSAGNAFPHSQDFLVTGDFTTPDRFLSNVIRANVSFTNVCGVCSLDLSFSLETEEYEFLPLNDTEQLILEAAFDYDMAGSGDLRFTYRLRDISFNERPTKNQVFGEFSMRYKHHISRKAYISAIVAREARQNDGLSLDAAEFRYGVSVGYDF